MSEELWTTSNLPRAFSFVKNVGDLMLIRGNKMMTRKKGTDRV